MLIWPAGGAGKSDPLFVLLTTSMMAKILRKIAGPKRPYVKRDSSKKRLSKEKSKQYSDFVRAAHNTINGLVKEGATRFNK